MCVCVCVCVCVCMCVCVYVSVYYVFLSQSSVDRHLDYFHVLATVDDAALNIEVHESFQIRVYIFFWLYT